MDSRRSVLNEISSGDHDLYRLAVAHCRTTEKSVRADPNGPLRPAGVAGDLRTDAALEMKMSGRVPPTFFCENPLYRSVISVFFRNGCGNAPGCLLGRSGRLAKLAVHARDLERCACPIIKRSMT